MLTSCDVGVADEGGHGPALHLIASYPVDGQGTNAAPDAELDCAEPSPGCPVPTDAVIELRFDRFLLPGGRLAGGVSLFSGNPAANGVALSAQYDLLERVVLLRPSRPLQDQTLYTVEIPLTADRARSFWAFDGAPLQPGPVPLRFSFRTGRGPGTTPLAAPGVPDSCESVSQDALAACAGCHGARPSGGGQPSLWPPMGLDLSGARGLFETAIGHVAHQTQTGSALSGQGLRSPARFGVQMNLIDPGSPATSYLLYKLLIKAQNFRPPADDPRCASGYHEPVADQACQAPDAQELERLRDWFVLGEPMPQGVPGEHAVPEPSLDRAQLVRIARWISAGAACPPP